MIGKAVFIHTRRLSNCICVVNYKQQFPPVVCQTGTKLAVVFLIFNYSTFARSLCSNWGEADCPPLLKSNLANEER